MTPLRSGYPAPCPGQRSGLSHALAWLFRAVGLVWVVLVCAAALPARAACPDEARAALADISHGEVERATERLERALPGCAKNKDVQFWRGQAYRRLGRSADARTAFQAFADLDPSNPDGPKFVGEALLAERRWAEAQRQFEKALRLDPSNPELSELVRTAASAHPVPSASAAPSAPAPAPSVAPSATPGNDPRSGEAKDHAPSRWERIDKEGVAGVLGARHAWWSRMIALVLFFVLSAVAIAISANFHSPLDESSAMGSFFQTLWPAGLAYMVFWGTPSGGAWALFILYVFWFVLQVRAVLAGRE